MQGTSDRTPAGEGSKSSPQKASRLFGDSVLKRLSARRNTARGRSLSIILVYFFFGCVWIVLSDLVSEYMIVERSSIFLVSMLKGLFYVLVTAILLYALIYPTLRRLMKTRDEMKSMNKELDESNNLYKGLYQEYDRKQSLMKSLINSIPDLIFYKDTNSNYIGCNKAFEKFVGKPEDQITGSTDQELFDENIAGLLRRMDSEILAANQSKKIEERFSYPDGSKMFFETLKTPYYDSEGNIIGLIGISRDITERKKKEEEITYLSHHDLLTGLYNRTFLQEELKRLDSESSLPLSVLMADINGLKLINDSLGHSAGDNVIADIARILKKCCRDGDVVARTGGDEFTILLPGTDSKTVQCIAEGIRKACAKRSEEITDHMLFANISLGHATKTNADEPLEKLLQSAEEFMYRQKIFEYKSMRSSILSSIKRTMFEKNYETEEHAERMAGLAISLGQALDLSAEDIVALTLLSTLHDIGKISIDKDILTKAGPLSDEEWREIRKHPEIGFRIAQSSPELVHIAEFILCHHERWDGKGYPQGLKGEDIPLLSRIISVVDAFDAMTQDRAYRKAMTKDEAVSELLKNAGTQFDPYIINVFIGHVIKE